MIIRHCDCLFDQCPTAFVASCTAELTMCKSMQLPLETLAAVVGDTGKGESIVSLIMSS